jgi:hypothetical protein
MTYLKDLLLYKCIKKELLNKIKKITKTYKLIMTNR